RLRADWRETSRLLRQSRIFADRAQFQSDHRARRRCRHRRTADDRSGRRHLARLGQDARRAGDPFAGEGLLMDAKEIIARRVAQEVKPAMLVNLGIGLPSLVANYLPKDVHVFFQAENGVIGLGARPPEGMEDPDLTDAGGGYVTAMPGAASIDSAMSFGLI